MSTIRTKTFKFVTTIEVLVAGEIQDGEIVEAIRDNIDTSGNLIAIDDDTCAYVEDVHMEWVNDEED